MAPRKPTGDDVGYCGRGPCERGDACRAAVRRAYAEMRSKGEPDRYAFEAAVTIYRWHHPEVPGPVAQDIVTDWVWDGVRH